MTLEERDELLQRVVGLVFDYRDLEYEEAKKELDARTRPGTDTTAASVKIYHGSQLIRGYWGVRVNDKLVYAGQSRTSVRNLAYEITHALGVKLTILDDLDEDIDDD